MRPVVCLAVVLLAMTACQKKQEEAPQKEDNKGTLLLKSVGGVKVEADRNQPITLNLLAAYIGVGPAKDLPIEVSFSGEAKGQLSVGTYITNQDGFLEIPFVTPDEENATVLIRCKAEGAPALNFTVEVGKEIVSLDWVGKRPHYVRIGTNEDFRVSATNQRGAPVAGVLIEVEMIGKSNFGAGFVGLEGKLTDGSGQALFTFTGGSGPASYQVRAKADKLNDAKLDIVVAESIPVQQTCEFTSECPAGDVCSEGVCLSGSRRCRMAHPEDCPDGYACVDNICQYDCGGGACVAPGADVDVTGRWRTEYVFDFSETLGFLQALGDPIDKIDTLFQGKLPVDIPILGPIIELMMQELIKAFVPDWVPKLATGLNDLWSALTDVHIWGTMELQPDAPGSAVLRGEEVWDIVEVKVASLCPRRHSDPNYPRCATVNIQLGRSLGSGITASATTQPFTGLVDHSTLKLQHRQALLEMRMLISTLIDLIVNISTNGREKTIEEAIVAAVDCPNLAIEVDSLVCDMTDGGTCHLSWFESVCKIVVTVASGAIGDAIDKVPLEWTLVDFEQQATAIDKSQPQDYRADELKDGTVSGSTNFFTDRPMTGTFSGLR